MVVGLDVRLRRFLREGWERKRRECESEEEMGMEGDEGHVREEARIDKDGMVGFLGTGRGDGEELEMTVVDSEVRRELG